MAKKGSSLSNEISKMGAQEQIVALLLVADEMTNSSIGADPVLQTLASKIEAVAIAC